MSSYFRITKHPQTGNWERAFWIDDYFGSHKYGVQFPNLNDPVIYDPREHVMETKDWD